MKKRKADLNIKSVIIIVVALLFIVGIVLLANSQKAKSEKITTDTKEGIDELVKKTCTLNCSNQWMKCGLENNGVCPDKRGDCTVEIDGEKRIYECKYILGDIEYEGQEIPYTIDE